MINKFEAIGISVSILAMVVALFLLRVDNATFSLAGNQGGGKQAATLIVADGADQGSLQSAIADASSKNGKLNHMIVDDVVIGDGEKVKKGDTVTVDYIGTLQNGQEFDNSYKRGTPFTFTVGEGKVIAGWEQGVVGMQVGGKRILVVPSDLAYGNSGYGPIPGKATLVFAIELQAIK